MLLVILIMGVAILTGIYTNDGYALFISIVVGLLLSLAWIDCWEDAKKKMSTPEGRAKVKHNIDMQNKYSNQYNSIDFFD